MIKGVSMANVRKQLFSTVPNKYNDKNIALHINPEGDTTTIRIHTCKHAQTYIKDRKK